MHNIDELFHNFKSRLNVIELYFDNYKKKNIVKKEKGNISV